MREGKFIATVVRHDYEESPAKGTPGLVFQFEADVDGAYEKIEKTIWLTEGAKKIARANLKDLGFNPDKQEIDVLIENPTMLIGNKVQIVVDTKEYKGVESWEVKYINPVPKDGGTGERKDYKDLTKLLRDAKSAESDENVTEVVEHFTKKEEKPKPKKEVKAAPASRKECGEKFKEEDGAEAVCVLDRGHQEEHSIAPF